MYRLGIDIGGTNVSVGVVNEKGQILRRQTTPTLAFRPVTEIVDSIGKLCRPLISGLEITSAGAGMPGSVDSDTGVAIFAGNLPFLNTPIAEMLSQAVGMPVKIGNDADCAALGEAVFGAGVGAESLLMLTLGTGVGGGYIINGKIYNGFNHLGGEFGHMVIQMGGRQCTCGRQGCFEAYASATGIRATTMEVMDEFPTSILWEMHPDKQNISGRSPYLAAARGDKAGMVAIERFTNALACGIANYINALSPEIVCIGGGVSNEGDNLLIPLRKAVDKERFAKNYPRLSELRIAKLKSDAGIIGAALL